MRQFLSYNRWLGLVEEAPVGDCEPNEDPEDKDATNTLFDCSVFHEMKARIDWVDAFGSTLVLPGSCRYLCHSEFHDF